MEHIRGKRMKITVYGVKKEVRDNMTVSELIMEESHFMSPLYVTVAINDVYIPMENYSTTIVHDGDNVDMVAYMDGG